MTQMPADKWAAGCVVAIAAQAGRFAEEFTTGLHERLPAVFGLPPISLPLFVSVNLAWLGIWALSVWGLARRVHVALFPLWFLAAVADVANGLLHPLLALNVGGYFPGLTTSPLMAAVGVLLLGQLARDNVSPHARMPGRSRVRSRTLLGRSADTSRAAPVADSDACGRFGRLIPGRFYEAAALRPLTLAGTPALMPPWQDLALYARIR